MDSKLEKAYEILEKAYEIAMKKAEHIVELTYKWLTSEEFLKIVDEFYENKEEKTQMKTINRAKIKGSPLDVDCKRAHTTTGEYGKEDKRVFCLGYIDCMYDELLDKCKKCKAHINNLTPLKDFIEVETRPLKAPEGIETR